MHGIFLLSCIIAFIVLPSCGHDAPRQNASDRLQQAMMDVIEAAEEAENEAFAENNEKNEINQENGALAHQAVIEEPAAAAQEENLEDETFTENEEDTIEQDAKKKPDANYYRISSGDLLEIVTWKEPDLTRDVVVRIDGMITFPLLGDVKASGLTPMELKEVIQSRLQDYVKEPLVTVTVKDAGSQRFYIIGEVVKTGVYPMNHPLTLLQAFALAGGFTEWADKKDIILVRQENGKEKLITINYYDLITKEGLLSQNIRIKSDDTIVVP